MATFSHSNRITVLKAQLKLLTKDFANARKTIRELKKERDSLKDKILSLRKLMRTMQDRYAKLENGMILEKHSKSLTEAIAANEVVALEKDTTDGEE